MNDCYLQLEGVRIPIVRRNLRVLAECIEETDDPIDFLAIHSIALDIREYLNDPNNPGEHRPMPTDETLEKLRLLGADITNHPVPDDKDGTIAVGLLEIGSTLVEAGTSWMFSDDNPAYGYHTLLCQRETLKHWVNELRSIDGRGSLEVAEFGARLQTIMQDEPTEGAF